MDPDVTPESLKNWLFLVPKPKPKVTQKGHQNSPVNECMDLDVTIQAPQNWFVFGGSKTDHKIES